MSRRMMRYVVPDGDSELNVTLREPNYTFAHEYDRNVIIYIEEDEDASPEPATLKFFETGEAVEGEWLATLANGKTARHLYWVNAYDFQQKKHDAALAHAEEAYAELAGEGYDVAGREHIRGADDLPQV